MPYKQDWPEWFDYAKPGDVLKTPEGDFRVIRNVTRYPPKWPGHKGMIFFEFAIRRCSWTRRPITTKTGSSIRKWDYTGKRVELDSELDKEIERECNEPVYYNDRRIFCCDVVDAP